MKSLNQTSSTTKEIRKVKGELREAQKRLARIKVRKILRKQARNRQGIAYQFMGLISEAVQDSLNQRENG